MAQIMSRPATAPENQAESSPSSTQPHLKLHLELKERIETLIKMQEATFEEMRKLREYISMFYGVEVKVKIKVENSPRNDEGWETPPRPATPEFDLKSDTDLDFEKTVELPPTPDTKWEENQTLHGLEKKMRDETGNEIWKCYCSLQLKSYPKMKSHFIKKTQIKRLQCTSCPKKFHLGYQLKKHCKTEHGILIYVCSMCFFQFTKVEEYKEHFKTSLFETCAARLYEKKSKHEPYFTPLKEGTYGMLSVRHTEGNYHEFDLHY